MIEEKVLIDKFLNNKNTASRKRERLKKPDWLKIKIGDPTNQNAVLKLIDGLNLHTVCQEARCPNIFECWTDKTRDIYARRRYLHADLRVFARSIRANRWSSIRWNRRTLPKRSNISI